MKVVVQRVSSAKVTVNNKIKGEINRGLLVLLGIHNNDKPDQLDWLVNKILRLRIFNDDNDKMNLSVSDIKGEILVISQFTLYGNAKKGTRPSYIEAAKPELAIPLYEMAINELKKSGLKVESGEFGAKMSVELINEGPVTNYS